MAQRTSAGTVTLDITRADEKCSVATDRIVVIQGVF